MGLNLFTPHLRAESVLELTPQRLRELTLDALLLDVDCTLKRYPSPNVDPDVAAWLAGLRAEGFSLCLVSNGRQARIRRLAEGLGLPFIAKACKPLPFRCRRALGRLGAARARTAMVGDQIFADVMAGRLAGLYTILVRPMHPEEEPWWTRMKRPAERWLLNHLDRRNA
jgi:uncharacterized protein